MNEANPNITGSKAIERSNTPRDGGPPAFNPLINTFRETGAPLGEVGVEGSKERAIGPPQSDEGPKTKRRSTKTLLIIIQNSLYSTARPGTQSHQNSCIQSVDLTVGIQITRIARPSCSGVVCSHQNA